MPIPDRGFNKKHMDMLFKPFGNGANFVVSLILGFDIDEELSVSEKDEFYKLIAPLMERAESRLKNREKGLVEYYRCRCDMSPGGFLNYLLQEEMKLI